jgi:hypothetical protein
VATLYTFAFKRGVGVETISEFFIRLHLETHVGCSPSALRSLLQQLEVILLEIGQRWEQKGSSRGRCEKLLAALTRRSCNC